MEFARSASDSKVRVLGEIGWLLCEMKLLVWPKSAKAPELLSSGAFALEN